MRIGFGYDVHRLVEGRKLILGGVHIPHHTGLLGHSDADVLVHSICDGLLGALAMGDIGQHFADSDPTFKDIDSRILLKRCYDMVLARNYKIANMDATICAAATKLSPYVCHLYTSAADDEGLGVDLGGRLSTHRKDHHGCEPGA